MITHTRGLAAALAFGGLLAAEAPAARDILVGSWSTHSIRRHHGDTGVHLGDFVPPGTGGLTTPDGMDFGPDGVLYVSSSGSNAVLMFDGQSGNLLGTFTTSVTQPGNLQFGPDGGLYVCNKNTGEVRRFDHTDGSQYTLAASGGGLTQPVGMAWRGNVLYVADFAGGAVRTYDATTGAALGNLTTIATPLILRFNAAGDLLVSSHQLSTLRRLDPDTGANLGPGITGGNVSCPVGHMVGPTGEMIVASWQNHRLIAFDADSGAFLRRFAIGDGLALPNDLLASLEFFCDGDANDDRLADFDDLLVVLGGFGQTGVGRAQGDLTGDGEVTIDDLLEILAAFGAAC